MYRHDDSMCCEPAVWSPSFSDSADVVRVTLRKTLEMMSRICFSRQSVFRRDWRRLSVIIGLMPLHVSLCSRSCTARDRPPVGDDLPAKSIPDVDIITGDEEGRRTLRARSAQLLLWGGQG